MSSPDYSTCGSSVIFGGYCKINQDSEVSKEVQNLPSHYSYTMVGKFYFLDDFTCNGFMLSDLANQYNLGPIDSLTFTSTELCGSSQKPDKIIEYSITKAHTESYLKLTFKTLKTTDTFHPPTCEVNWGIERLSVIINLCDKTCRSCTGPEKTDCLYCWDNGALSGSTCTCNTNYMLY